MSEKLRAVVIGAAHVHILEVCSYLAVSERVALTAVADPAPLMPRELTGDKPYTRRWNLDFVRRYGMKIYDDYREMLDREKPDFALITTENAVHAQVYQACAERGIATSVEKPLAVSLDEAEAMARAARLAGAELYVNWPIAWRPWLYQMKDVLDSGRVGKLQKIRHLAGLTGPVGPGAVHRGTDGVVAQPMSDGEKAALWWYNRACGGGALLDMCCYGCMMSDYLAGEPATGVLAMRGNFGSDFGDAEDNACLIARFPKAMSVIEGTWTTPALAIQPGPELYAEGGVIRCERRGAGAVVKVMDIYGHEEELPPPPANPHWRNIAEAYAHHALDGADMPPFTQLDRNLRVIAMLDAARTSCAQGRFVPVDSEPWARAAREG